MKTLNTNLTSKGQLTKEIHKIVIEAQRLASRGDNFHTLYVRPDGTYFWAEEVSANSWIKSTKSSPLSSIMLVAEGVYPGECYYWSDAEIADGIETYLRTGLAELQRFGFFESGRREF